METIIGVRFKTAGKIYHFSPGKLTIARGQHVIVETARGMECGRVVTVDGEGKVISLNQQRRTATILLDNSRTVVAAWEDVIEQEVEVEEGEGKAPEKQEADAKPREERRPRRERRDCRPREGRERSAHSGGNGNGNGAQGAEHGTRSRRSRRPRDGRNGERQGRSHSARRPKAPREKREGGQPKDAGRQDQPS